MTDKQRVARGAGQHADHRQPDVRYALRSVSTESDTQHVRQGFEQRPRVLLPPVGVLSEHIQHTRQPHRHHADVTRVGPESLFLYPTQPDPVT